MKPVKIKALFSLLTYLSIVSCGKSAEFSGLEAKISSSVLSQDANATSEALEIIEKTETVTKTETSTDSNGRIGLDLTEKFVDLPALVLSGMPTGVSDEVDLKIKVTGPAPAQKYNFAIVSGNVSCVNAKYSAEAFSFSQSIESWINAFPDGVVRVCARAVDVQGNKQSPQAAAEASWTKLSYLSFLEKSDVPDMKPYSVALASQGSSNFVYVGLGNGISEQNGIALFLRDPVTGGVSLRSKWTSSELGTFSDSYIYRIIVSPDQKNLYAFGWYGVSKYSANRLESTIANFEIQPDGSLVLASLLTNYGSLNLAGIAGVSMSADGNYLYATAELLPSPVVVFSRDKNNRGRLQFVQSNTSGGLDRADGIATSPDSKHIYAAGAYNGQVAAYKQNVDGTLSVIQTLNPSSNPDLAHAKHVVTSKDGNYVFVYSWDKRIIVFSRDVTTGLLTQRSSFSTNATVSEMKPSFDGSRLFVPQHDSTISVYTKGAGDVYTLAQKLFDGKNKVTGIASPFGFVLSPDFKFAYTAGFSSATITVFDVKP